MNIVFLFFSVSFIWGNSVFEFGVWPECSKEKPLRLSQKYEMVAKMKYPDDYSYKVSHFSSGGTVVNTETIVKKSPFISAFGKDLGKSYVDEGPDVISIEVLNEKGVVVASSEKKMIYWDFRYKNLKFTGFNFSDTGACQTIVTPIPSNPILDELTKIYQYVPRIFPGRGLDSSIGSQFQGTNSIKWTFAEPGIIYFQVLGWTGVMSKITSGSEYFALVCCQEDGTCPKIDPSYKGVVHTMTQRIKDDQQMPFFKDKVTLIENAIIFLPLGGANPNQIRLDLPANLTLDFENFKMPYKPVITLESDHTNEKRRNNVIVVEKTGSAWSYKNRAVGFAFQFNGLPFETEFDSYFRLDNGTDQHMKIVAKEVEPFPSQLPSLLNTGFEWSSISYYKDFSIYASFGFNNIPITQGLGYWKTLESKYGDFTPEERKTTKWQVDGFQLRLSIEMSLFSASNRYQATPSLITQVLKASYVDPSMFPSYFTKEQVEEESKLWNNAIEFYNQTKIPDIGYNGYFYTKQLELVTSVVNYTKPEWVNFDIECWGGQKAYISTASKSKNIQNRRKGGETDQQAVMRIVDEYLGSIQNSVKSGSESSQMVWYGVQGLGVPYAYQPANSEQYLKYGMVPQPSLYLPQKNIEVTAEIIRHNRMYTGNTQMIPMPSPGTYGQFDSSLNFDSCIQIFGNGGTGIMFYGIQSLNDLEIYLLVQQCIAIFTKYEEIVVKGELAFHDFTMIDDNLVLGSMKLEEKYIVSLSKKQKLSSGSSTLDNAEESFLLELPYSSSLYSISDLKEKVDITAQSVYNEGVISLKLRNDQIPTVLLFQKSS